MNNFTNNRWLSVITLLLLTANIVTLALLWTNKKADRGEQILPPPPAGQAFEFLTHEAVVGERLVMVKSLLTAGRTVIGRYALLLVPARWAEGQ